MATIFEELNENLVAFNEEKQLQKSALEEKGQDMTDVPFTQYHEKIKAIQTGTAIGEYFLKVVDYDGTELGYALLNEGDTFTLPAPPTHDGLVFQEWSCSQDIIDNTITIDKNNVMVGAVYTTASGLNEFDIELTETTGLSITFKMDGTKYWGDGTSDTSTTHTYADYGNYTISCDGTTINAAYNNNLFGGSSTTFCRGVKLATVKTFNNYTFSGFEGVKVGILSNNLTNLGKLTGVYKNLNCLIIPKSVISFEGCSSCYRLSSIVIPNTIQTLPSEAFNYSYALHETVIPNSVTKISTAAFRNCNSLRKIIIPDSVQTIESYFLGNAYGITNVKIPERVKAIANSTFASMASLENIDIPDSVTDIGKYAFQNDYNLKQIKIPEGIETINSNCFFACYGLRDVKIPSSVNKIDSEGFYQCFNIIKYDFTQHTTVPTLSNTNAFSGININCKIYVPDSLYNEWISATNWSTYASYIAKASEMPAE